MLAAELADRPITDGVRSLEVRWFLPGPLAAAVTGWFGRFPSADESREDSYLLDPQLRGLSVKVRASGALEVKAYGGSPGILEVPGRARGHLESWRKWAFPVSPVSRSADPPGWKPVRKQRRISRFSSSSGWAATGARQLGEQPQCEVELTEIHAAGEVWWTLGFEATGAGDLVRRELEAAADLVFARALPGLEPGLWQSRSYAAWLSRTPGYSDCTGLVTSDAG